MEMLSLHVFGPTKIAPIQKNTITTVLMVTRSQIDPQQRDEESTTAFDAEKNLTATAPHHRPNMVSQKSSIHSRMMTHIAGGRANAAISDCFFVMVTGQLLSFNAGYINGACLSGWLMKNGRQQAVASLTGAYTESALLLVDGNVTDFGFQVCMILSFTFGAFLSGLLTPKATPYRIEPTYGPTFCLGGLILLGSSHLAALHSNSTRWTWTKAMAKLRHEQYLQAQEHFYRRPSERLWGLVAGSNHGDSGKSKDL
jgi:hypothetical protein